MPEPETTPPASPPAPSKPDAIMVAAGSIHGTAPDRANQLQQRFGPILGGTVLCRNQTSFNFLTVDPDATYFFPKTHPTKPGAHRYRWEDDKTDPQVKYGYLNPDPPLA